MGGCSCKINLRFITPRIENKTEEIPHLVYLLVFNTSLFNGALIEKLLVWCLSMENPKYRQKHDAHNFSEKYLQIGIFIYKSIK